MIARGGADALQAEKDLRGAVKRSSNGIKKCNWWDAAASPPCYCDAAAGYSGDKTTGLFRCKKHGGNVEQLHKSNGGGAYKRCDFPGCDEERRGQCMGNVPGYNFCGSKQKGCIKRALDYEAVHGKKPEGVSWAEFYCPST